LLNGKEITVKTALSQYEIVVKANVLYEAGQYIKSLSSANRMMLVSDSNVYALYGQSFKNSMEINNLDFQTVIVKPGERSKTIREANRLYQCALEAGLDRNSPIIALGGGVIGDLAGFVAATYLRGVPLIMIPTSLISQVDSSVGGKVAVNHPRGKNLIGAIYPPRLVLIDPSTLGTLPERELKSGMAEIIKHGIIEDAGILAQLDSKLPLMLENDLKTQSEFIAATVSSKVRVVEKDEFERDYRRILNFGHTIGHALESATNYRYYNHGEAVFIGMLASLELTLALGLIERDLTARIYRLIHRIGIKKPPKSLTAEQVIGKLNVDKKRQGDELVFIMVEKIGKPLFTVVEDSSLIQRVIGDYLLQGSNWLKV